MKRLYVSILALSAGTAAIAQTTTGEMISFSSPFISVPALLAFIPFFTEFLKKKISLRGLGLQIFTWCIGLVLAVIGKLLNLGVFDAMEWEAVITTGIVIAMGSNVAYKAGLTEAVKKKETL